MVVPALVVGLLVAGAWAMLHEPRARWVGEPAPAAPVQTRDELPPAFGYEGYVITPLARYALTAVVLARAHYRLDRGAALGPIDLALGWGPMSRAEVINGLSISQSGRWYEYSWPDEPPLDPGLIALNSANTHCLPDPKVRKALFAVGRHDLVSLEGYLVEVTGEDEFRWTSSTTRDDTGGGACEVVWLTSVRRKRL